jgi:hypothetical protein
LILPQLDAAEQAVSIAYNLDVRRQLEIDRRRVATADVQAVVVERLRQLVNRFAQVLVPLLLALLPERFDAQLIFLGLAVEQRMMAQFEMNSMPLDEQHQPESRAECDYQLIAVAGDASELGLNSLVCYICASLGTSRY